MAKGTNGSPSGREVLESLRLLQREKGFQTVKLWLRKLFRDRGKFRPWLSLMALRAEFLWSSGRYEELRVIATHMAKDHSSTLGYFYLAQCAHLHGEEEAAVGWLTELLALNPHHSEGIHLLALCQKELGERERSWQLLTAQALRRERVKTWQCMANLVESGDDFLRLRDCHRDAVAAGVIPAKRWEILNQLSLGAIRAGDYETAKSIWRGIIRDRLGSSLHAEPPKRKIETYSSARAGQALVDINRVLRSAGIEMFLVSGTLLGCIREGKLLGHDKDIDVGIWDVAPRDQLTTALKSSGLFHFLASRCPDIIRLRHVNGIPVDLFYHHREGGTCWHGGVKMRWHNTPFTLAEVLFLGETFHVPADHRRYFVENYGDDWETSKPDFDSTFDTPNGRLTCVDEIIIYTYRQLMANINHGAGKKIEYYLSKLEQFGESDLASEVRSAYRGLGIPLGDPSPTRSVN